MEKVVGYKAVELVKQEDECGCGVACAAMILGATYAEIRKDFETDFSKKGMPLKKFIEYIADHGYSVIKKECVFFNHKNELDAEMVKPFAEVHVIEYTPHYDSKDSHVIVMDKEGKFYCPSGTEHTDLGYQINAVVGFYK